jgi:Undecaprenyl-phosphate glucose phosphotransferase
MESPLASGGVEWRRVTDTCIRNVMLAAWMPSFLALHMMRITIFHVSDCNAGAKWLHKPARTACAVALIAGRRGLLSHTLPGRMGLNGCRDGFARAMSIPLQSATDINSANAIGRPARKRSYKRQIPAAVFSGLVQACDPPLLFAGSLACWLLAGRLQGEAAWWGPLGGGDLLAALVAAWVTASCLRHGDTYRLSRLLSRAAQARWLAISFLGGGGVLVLAAMVAHLGARPALPWVAGWLAVNGLLLGLARVAAVQVAVRLRREGRLARRVALVGATELGRSFVAALGGHDETDIDLVGIYDDSPAPETIARASLPFRGDIAQLIADGQSGALDAVVIALPATEAGRVTRLGDQLGHLVLDVFVVPDLATLPFGQVCTLGNVPVGLLARRPLSDWQVVQKALFDRIVAALLLLALAPLLALLALLVRLDSPGPVLFRQRRIGFSNRPFDCLKFRTMYHHMADALADRQTTRGDSRITRVGHWLRRLSLDELPQLFNVLNGEMSLVGPRPHAPNTKAASRLFQDVVADYARRHRVKPGITGWAQVNGWRGETTTEEAIEQRVLHDLHYIQNWSLARDLRILLMTVVRIYGDPKAY